MAPGARLVLGGANQRVFQGRRGSFRLGPNAVCRVVGSARLGSRHECPRRTGSGAHLGQLGARRRLPALPQLPRSASVTVAPSRGTCSSSTTTSTTSSAPMASPSILRDPSPWATTSGSGSARRSSKASPSGRGAVVAAGQRGHERRSGPDPRRRQPCVDHPARGHLAGLINSVARLARGCRQRRNLRAARGAGYRGGLSGRARFPRRESHAPSQRPLDSRTAACRPAHRSSPDRVLPSPPFAGI